MRDKTVIDKPITTKLKVFLALKTAEKKPVLNNNYRNYQKSLKRSLFATFKKVNKIRTFIKI